jgi:hypothetical protein
VVTPVFVVVGPTITCDARVLTRIALGYLKSGMQSHKLIEPTGPISVFKDGVAEPF